MFIILTEPVQVPDLNRISIANIEIEHNPQRGRAWAEIWCVWGYLEEPGNPMSFVECKHPVTGEDATLFKIEDGHHPIAHDMALGKCPTCGAWHQRISSVCGVDGCDGDVAPYDGFTRVMAEMTADGEDVGTAVQRIAYTFLLTEVIPDHNTWELRPLVAGTPEV